jgi:hypothetical protein
MLHVAFVLKLDRFAIRGLDGKKAPGARGRQSMFLAQSNGIGGVRAADARLAPGIINGEFAPVGQRREVPRRQRTGRLLGLASGDTEGTIQSSSTVHPAHLDVPRRIPISSTACQAQKGHCHNVPTHMKSTPAFDT